MRSAGQLSRDAKRFIHNTVGLCVADVSDMTTAVVGKGIVAPFSCTTKQKGNDYGDDKEKLRGTSRHL